MKGAESRRPYVLVTASIVCLDQITKSLVNRFMGLHESRSLIDGVLKLTYVRNRGAAFGILSDAHLPYQPALFALVSLMALGAIAFYSARLPASSKLPQTALALVMGGAVGNLLDRAARGFVVDFVDVFWGTHHWPAFNMADSAISTGVGLLILDILVSPGRDESTKADMVATAAPGGRNH